MSLATGSEDGMFHICSHNAKRVNQSVMGENDRKAEPLSFFAPAPANTALAATLALLRPSKELSG
jgi:hypothetical protein